LPRFKTHLNTHSPEFDSFYAVIFDNKTVIDKFFTFFLDILIVINIYIPVTLKYFIFSTNFPQFLDRIDPRRPQKFRKNERLFLMAKDQSLITQEFFNSEQRFDKFSSLFQAKIYKLK
jgi:hypothetical protein